MQVLPLQTQAGSAADVRRRSASQSRVPEHGQEFPVRLPDAGAAVERRGAAR